MSSGLPTVFLFIFSLNFFFNVSIRLKFRFLNNTLIFFFPWLSSSIIFTKNFTVSFNNKINWKLEGTNWKTLKAYRFLRFLFSVWKSLNFWCKASNLMNICLLQTSCLSVLLYVPACVQMSHFGFSSR